MASSGSSKASGGGPHPTKNRSKVGPFGGRPPWDVGKLPASCSSKERNRFMRPPFLVFLASLVGALTLVVLLGPVSSDRALSVRPAEAAPRVQVTAGFIR